jgi:hypothetical protein
VGGEELVIAALFVTAGGCYYGLPDVDPWDAERDARRYDGPHACIAHPPCGPWGAFARQGWTKAALGDDDGCFASALASVRKYGGVLEHPAYSSAWRAHGLVAPKGPGWWRDIAGGWCALVDQGHYGHDARKPTWLYAVGATQLPSLEWSASTGKVPFKMIGSGATAKGRAIRSATPLPFRDLLISIARSVQA